MPLGLITQRLFTGSDVFILLAVPFFILAGQIMEQGGVARRVIRVADESTKFVTGGLGHVTVLSNMFFAGISGAAVADTAALGPLSIPMMVHGGFPRDYATALVAVASVIGIIIPPSIPMVIYGMVALESITRLFLGGMVPGILIGLALMAVNYYKARKYAWGTRTSFQFRDFLSSLRDGVLALVMPGIIVGGILFGDVHADRGRRRRGRLRPRRGHAGVPRAESLPGPRRSWRRRQRVRRSSCTSSRRQGCSPGSSRISSCTSRSFRS